MSDHYPQASHSSIVSEVQNFFFLVAKKNLNVDTLFGHHR